MQPDCKNKRLPNHVILVNKYSIYIEDLNAGTWSRFFSSTDLSTTVEMFLYLEMRMQENLDIRRENVEVTGNFLNN